jgi:hypothetical protein
LGVQLEVVKDMNRTKVMLVFLLVWVILSSFALLILPSNAQKALKTIATYRAPMDIYAYERIFSGEQLNEFLEVKIPFSIQIGKPSDYNITTHFTWKVTMNAESHNQIISINYTFFSNDNYLFWIREDFIGALKGTFTGAYPPQTIGNPQTIKIGDNELKIKVNISRIDKKPSKCYFKLEIQDPHVNITALDLDSDGILDAADPLPTLNNYTGFSILGICGVFPVFMIKRHSRRKNDFPRFKT